jgi:hypothetical protein
MTPLAALAAIVGGEDAAVYGYSVAGAHVSGGARTKALAGLAAHRANRDRAAAAIVAAGGTPPPGAIAYDLGGPVTSPAQARDLMALVDNRLVAAYADAAAATVDGERRWAARTAAECATRAVGWGAAPQAFPTGT